jgi:putative transposase
MAMGRPKATLVLDSELREQLESLANSLRFLAQGVSGLYEELRPGRPRPISDERVPQLVRRRLKSKPKAVTHCSIRQIADETGISKSTVHRI